MGVVLVVALGLMAMRSGSYTWASAVLLVTCGLLSFGIVGIACGGTGARAWWVGFCVFGWGYLASTTLWPHMSRFGDEWSRTLVLLQSLMLALGVHWPAIFEGFVEDWTAPPFAAVAHSFWSLFFAVFGGALSHFFFARPIIASDRPVDEVATADRGNVRKTLIVGGSGLVLFTAVAVHGARTEPGLWAGATLMFTCGLFVLAALRAGFSQGRRRAQWLGVTLFGAGYLLLVSGHSEELTWSQYASNRLLNSLRPWLPSIPPEHRAGSDSIATANARILKTLERRVPFHFEDETPFMDVLTHIKDETRDPSGRDLPIYVDPIGLLEAEKTMQSPVRFAVQNVPLRTTLSLILRQLGMTYEVRGGLIHITSMSTGDFDPVPAYDDPFLLMGQCVLALLAGCLGGGAAPLACGLKR